MNESQIPASGAAAAPDTPPATPATENPAPSAQVNCAPKLGRV